MSKVSELESQRDQTLSRMESEYRERQDYTQSKMDEYKSQAEEKKSKGEDFSAEKEKWGEFKYMQDTNFDQYKEARKKVDSYYKDKIEDAQQEEQNDNEYNY